MYGRVRLTKLAFTWSTFVVGVAGKIRNTSGKDNQGLYITFETCNQVLLCRFRIIKDKYTCVCKINGMVI